MRVWLINFSMTYPWTFCLLFCPVVFNIPTNFVFKCWNRWLRSRNIKNHGWPPPHLDADGDFKKEPES